MPSSDKSRPLGDRGDCGDRGLVDPSTRDTAAAAGGERGDGRRDRVTAGGASYAAYRSFEDCALGDVAAGAGERVPTAERGETGRERGSVRGEVGKEGITVRGEAVSCASRAARKSGS